MRKILIILIILICSVSSSAGIKKDYKKAKQEQKYKFLHQIREAKQQGRLKLIRAKNRQRVRRRYGCNRHVRLYSMRACPR